MSAVASECILLVWKMRTGEGERNEKFKNVEEVERRERILMHNTVVADILSSRFWAGI
jgi:hypothetical protein